METFTIMEHEVMVTAPKEELLQLLHYLEETGAEGTWGDLAYQIKANMDEDFYMEVSK